MKHQLHTFPSVSLRVWRVLPFIILLVLGSVTFQTYASSQADTDTPRVMSVKRPLPVYPKYAIKNGIEGAVLANFSIDKDGNLSDIEVVDSDQEGLFDATAILALQKWVYTKPSHKMRNSYVAIEFVLTDQPAVTKYANVEIIQVRGE